MLDQRADVRAAGAREWSDEVEAVAALLGAAGVLDRATYQRRQLARDLVRRKATATDVLTWLDHHLARGRAGGWLLRALQSNPEHVWLARSQRAAERVAGPIQHLRVRQIEGLIDGILHREQHDVVPKLAASRLRAPSRATNDQDTRVG